MRKPEQPKGSPRGKLTGAFIEALASDWENNGQQVLERVREEAPSKYAELVSKLVPTETVVTQGNAFDGKSQEELADIIVEGASRDLPAYEEMLRRARKLAAERQAALPPELPADRRARLMREARRQQGSNGPWTSTG